MNARVSKGVLFLCVANSSRSQMAEGFARAFAPQGIAVLSAGSEPQTVNPFAVRVMAEVDIDIGNHASKSVEQIDPKMIDTVVTLCAEEVCPVWTEEVQRLHWPHTDPAAPQPDEAAQLTLFRTVRDQIRDKVEALFQ